MKEDNAITTKMTILSWIVNVTQQLDQATGCSDTWLNIVYWGCYNKRAKTLLTVLKTRTPR